MTLTIYIQNEYGERIVYVPELTRNWGDEFSGFTSTDELCSYYTSRRCWDWRRQAYRPCIDVELPDYEEE